MTEPGTLPEGIERLIERESDIAWLEPSQLDIERSLRKVADAAYAEGAAQERARIAKGLKERIRREVQVEAYRIARAALAADGIFLGPTPDNLLATRTPPPPEDTQDQEDPSAYFSDAERYRPMPPPPEAQE